MDEDLFDFLLGAYAGPLNKNLSPLWPQDPIRVDDQRLTTIDESHPKDVPARCCIITVQTLQDKQDHYRLSLTNCPTNELIVEYVHDFGGTHTRTNDTATIQCDFAIHATSELLELAEAVRQITQQYYANKNWKWVCPRTANSLVRLANHLRQFVCEEQVCSAEAATQRRKA